ncbi:hypothetical protein LNK15_14720, partial [Jeotgalicoccus huakuii]|nr:hypothetical protein [Jeotgalicoccus huakuii]
REIEPGIVERGFGVAHIRRGNVERGLRIIESGLRNGIPVGEGPRSGECLPGGILGGFRPRDLCFRGHDRRLHLIRLDFEKE